MSPFFSAGSALSLLSAERARTLRKPGCASVFPVARKRPAGLPSVPLADALPGVKSALTRSYRASLIWLATARRQMMSYRRYWSESSRLLSDSGVLAMLVGRIASCASCALRVLVRYRRGDAGR